MSQINISQKIDQAEKLIQDLKPILKLYGSFDFDILMITKETTTFLVQINFKRTNQWTSVIIQIIQKITNKYFYFNLENKDDNTKISLNIII
jgi:hypothetical protein